VPQRRRAQIDIQKPKHGSAATHTRSSVRFRKQCARYGAESCAFPLVGNVLQAWLDGQSEQCSAASPALVIDERKTALVGFGNLAALADNNPEEPFERPTDGTTET